MDLNWVQSVLYGLVSGLMEILPVSAQAHRVLLLKIFGVTGKSDLFALMIHLGIVVALYFNCNAHIVRMTRAKRLARTPKRRRKRPLDMKSLMDWSLLKTMLIPVILAVYLKQYTNGFQNNMLIIAGLLFVNGIVLYAPQFFPTGNRDSRTLSRVEGLLMGLGGGFSILPGISAMGAATSVGSVCGIDRKYALDMALLMNLGLNIGYVICDFLNILAGGAGPLSLMIIIRYIITGIVALGGTFLGIRLIRKFAANQGYAIFGLYCFGMAMFIFVLNLLA